MRKINNILITGGAGDIGSHIVEQLVKSKLNIIILDNLVTGYKKLTINFQSKIKGDVAQIYADTKKFKSVLKSKPKLNNINKII